MPETEVSIRIDLENGRPNWSRKDCPFGSDQQNRIDHGRRASVDAEDVMALLRDYHAAIGELVIKYSSTLERYAGDGVMVIFNDPVPVENPALQAVLMALEVREAIGALTETWRRLGHDIGFGIGIAHGVCYARDDRLRGQV